LITNDTPNITRLERFHNASIICRRAISHIADSVGNGV